MVFRFEKVVRKQIEHLFLLTKGLRNVVDYTFINEALSKPLSGLIFWYLLTLQLNIMLGILLFVCFLKM